MVDTKRDVKSELGVLTTLLAQGILTAKDGLAYLQKRYAELQLTANRLDQLRVGDLDDQIETLELKMDAVRLLRDHKPQEGVNYEEELAFMDIELKQLRTKRAESSTPQQES